jgi:hypothetical protein
MRMRCALFVLSSKMVKHQIVLEATLFFVKKGDQVEIQEAYKDFVFIRHLYGFSPDREDFEQFGWVKENTLKCEDSQ